MRPALRRLGVALASTALALVGTELWLRHFLPLDQPLFELDERLLHRPIPNARNLMRIADRGRFLTALNDLGHRGPDLGPKGSATRIAVYGDSMVLGEAVHEPEAMAARLAAHLAERGLDAECVNAGVTGYGPDQALGKFLADYEALRPDVVVLAICAHNDGGDLVRNQMVRVGPKGQAIPREPRLAPWIVESFERRRREARKPVILRWLEASHTEVGSVFPVVGDFVGAAAKEAELYFADDPEVPSLFEDYFDEDLVVAPESESARLKRSLYGAVLGRWAELTEELDVALLGVVVPSLDDLGRTWLAPEGESGEPYPAGRLSGVPLAAFAAHGVPALELDAAFAGAGLDAFLGGVSIDFHLSPAGHDLVARAVADELIRLGWLGD